MQNKDKAPYVNYDIKYDYDYPFCPVCGGKIKHPYTGEVTLDQLKEDSDTCIWGEVIDEHDNTLGYVPYCRHIHPYTLASENHKYIHYDLVELANCWDMPLNEKIEKLTQYLIHLYRNDVIKKEDIAFEIIEDKISNIIISKPISNLTINMTLNEDGKIEFTV